MIKRGSLVRVRIEALPSIEGKIVKYNSDLVVVKTRKGEIIIPMSRVIIIEEIKANF